MLELTALQSDVFPCINVAKMLEPTAHSAIRAIQTCVNALHTDFSTTQRSPSGHTSQVSWTGRAGLHMRPKPSVASP